MYDLVSYSLAVVLQNGLQTTCDFWTMKMHWNIGLVLALFVYSNAGVFTVTYSYITRNKTTDAAYV